MKKVQEIDCKFIGKKVTITPREFTIPSGNGDDVLAISKYCSYSQCSRYGQCPYTKGERYYIRGGKFVRFL